MENRLIFLYHRFRVTTEGGTQKGRRSSLRTCWSKPVGGNPRQIRDSIQPREVMGKGVCPANSLIPRCREKPRREWKWCPYRKPTQVGRERILRRSGDPSLRNSAN